MPLDAVSETQKYEAMTAELSDLVPVYFVGQENVGSITDEIFH